MNLLSLILIAMALIVGGCVFYVAWELSSGEFEFDQDSVPEKEEPGESKESKDPPGSE
jgi:hypothetical protein